MAIDDKIKDEKLHNDINREAARISLSDQVKPENMNILQVKKYYLLVKKKWQSKLSLNILLLVKHFRNK